MTIICLTQKAIHGYRETEKPTWNKENDCVINRLRNFAFSTTTMQHVHVLDLAENGHIKPHLDSIKVEKMIDMKTFFYLVKLSYI